MSDRAFKILSWVIGVLFVAFLFFIVVFLGFCYFDCDFSFFMWGVERLITITGGVQ